MITIIRALAVAAGVLVCAISLAFAHQPSTYMVYFADTCTPFIQGEAMYKDEAGNLYYCQTMPYVMTSSPPKTVYRVSTVCPHKGKGPAAETLKNPICPPEPTAGEPIFYDAPPSADHLKALEILFGDYD
jgi:hypothetical protein